MIIKKITFYNPDHLRQKSSYRSPLMSSLRKAPLCPEIVATSSGNKKTWDNFDLNAWNHLYMDWLVQLSNFILAISILGLVGMVRLERSRNHVIKDDLEILLKVTFMLVREVKLFWLPFSPVLLFIWNQSQAVSQRVLGFPPVQPGEQTHVLCLLGFNPFRWFLNFLLSKCSIFGRLLDKYFYRQCCRQSMKVFPTIKCLLWTPRSSLPASNEYLAGTNFLVSCLPN